MALFWRRKKEDRYITLGLNEPAAAPATDEAKAETQTDARRLEPPAANDAATPPPAETISRAELEAAPTGDAPTPTPIRADTQVAVTGETRAAEPTHNAPPAASEQRAESRPGVADSN
ncbi:MAG TPA: hypothetical protein VFX96_14125, partial [Pyrinomonadaceae bacterium]|nr:hypothetical protein [Pyrinomonadaceae bacterium]